MKGQTINIDDLLSTQLKPAFLATVEAVEGKPDLVKITPWMASAGCLCHLSLNLAKSSFQGVTPTGDTHVCCGKTLQVVELHLKSGESVALEDVFSQLHAAAKEAVSSHDPGAANPMRAPGPPPPTPPVWGWGPPPWQPSPVSHPVHPVVRQARYAAPTSYRAYCESNYDRCMERCYYSSDPDQCGCLCGSSYAACLGHPMHQC